ncbi:hypothetical protein [Candidatus Similichlamydia laticola]|uniref:Uncharacterized protein n=1 Tax=Candidatus Similichlamydia laticola TaxID=2170265 RepID=A0A369KLI0_9BACT|nr:hypothetical protein [Candidatus Similichlamydia laticola]RDB31876.1 hypothetical protein HAT2_00010 [Candidatus Similichlamydia laticola]
MDNFNEFGGNPYKRFREKEPEEKKQERPELPDAFDALLNNFLSQSGADEKSIGSLKKLLGELGSDNELKEVLKASSKGSDFSNVYKAAQKLTAKISSYSKKDEFKEAMASLDREKMPQLQDVIDSQKTMFADYFGKVMESAPESADFSPEELQGEIVQGVNQLFDEMAVKIQGQNEAIQAYRDKMTEGGTNGLDASSPDFEKNLEGLMKSIENDEGYKDLQTRIEGFVNSIYEKMIPDPKVRGQMHLYGKVDRVSRVTNRLGLVPDEEQKRREKEKKDSPDGGMFLNQRRV